MVRECLANTVQHANASWVDINLYCRKGLLSIMVEDDGTGFDLEEVRSRIGNGQGFKRMEARAASLDGSFDIDVHKDRKGTLINIELPTIEQSENYNCVAV
jgi:signal transduction histidine kinase